MAESKLKEKPKWQDIVHIQVNGRPIEDFLDKPSGAISTIGIFICAQKYQINDENCYFQINDVTTICKGNILVLADLSGAYWETTNAFRELSKYYEFTVETLELYIWDIITKLCYDTYSEVQSIIIAIKDYPSEMLSGLEMDTRWRLLREYTSVDDNDVQIHIYMHKREMEEQDE